MFEQFVITWNKWRIWDKKKYTSLEVSEILTLQEIYKEVFGALKENDLLDFDIEKKQPKPNITDSTITSYRRLCSKRLGYDSYIAANANSLLLNIAQFLHSQAPKGWLEIKKLEDITDKMFENHYPNSPVNLFCLQLANWLTDSLMKAQCKKETSDDINRWLEYLQRARREVFNKPEHVELRKLITTTLHILKNTDEQVALKIRSHHIKENLESLVNLGKNIVAFTFEYLAYALNAEEMPLNCSIINIHNDENKVLSFLNESPSGLYLLTLAHARPICELFDLPWDEKKNKAKEKLALAEEKKPGDSSLVPTEDIETFIHRENGKVSENTVLALNHHLGKIQKASPSGPILPTTEICGIIRALPKEKTTILNHFIALHGLLLLFATTVLNCKEASEVANAGGDILLCFAAKRHLQFSMLCYQKLGSEIAFHLQQLSAWGKKLEEKIDIEQKNQIFSNWLKNFISSESIFKELVLLLNDTAQYTIKVLESIENIQATIRDAKNRLNNFIRTAEELAHQHQWLLPSGGSNLLAPGRMTVSSDEIRISVLEDLPIGSQPVPAQIEFTGSAGANKAVTSDLPPVRAYPPSALTSPVAKDSPINSRQDEVSALPLSSPVPSSPPQSKLAPVSGL